MVSRIFIFFVLHFAFLSFAEAVNPTAKVSNKDIFAANLSVLRNVDQAFIMLAFNQKYTDALLNIARDLQDAKISNTLPHMTLQGSKIFIEGVYSGLEVTSSSPITISAGGVEWSYSKARSLDENYFALKKIVNKRQKSVSKWSLFLSEARADKLRPELPKGYDNNDLALDLGIIAATAPLAAGLPVGTGPVLATVGAMAVSLTAKHDLSTRISCNNGEFSLIDDTEFFAIKVEVTEGNKKNKYFRQDLKTHETKEISAANVRGNRMAIDKVAGFCKEGLISAESNASLNEALQKGRVASNLLRGRVNNSATIPQRGTR